MLNVFSSFFGKRSRGENPICREESSLIDQMRRRVGGKLLKVTRPTKGHYHFSDEKEKMMIEIGSKWPFSDESLSAMILEDVAEADKNIEDLTTEISRVLRSQGICLSLQLDAMQAPPQQPGLPQGIPPSTLVMAFERRGLFSRHDFLMDSGRFAVLSSRSKEMLNRYGKELDLGQSLPIVPYEGEAMNVLPMAGARFENTKLILEENAAFHLFNRNLDCKELNILMDIEDLSTENRGVMLLNGFPCFYRDAMKRGEMNVEGILIPPGGTLLQWQGPPMGIKRMRIETFKIEAAKFCEWLPFDQYQRYWTITEALKRGIPSHPRKILDIGGYPGLIQPFLPGDEIWVTDITPCDRPHYVRAADINLPFDDEFFDGVVSADTLEHIPKKDRLNAVKEMVRVSQKAVILGFPFEEGPAPMVDTLLDEYHRVELGSPFPFLREHLELGLPSRQEVIRWLEEMGFHVTHIPNAYAPTFLPMMRQEFFFLSQPKRHGMFREWNRYYNRQFAKSDNREPAYRCILVAGREKISCHDLWSKDSDVHQTIPFL